MGTDNLQQERFRLGLSVEEAARGMGVSTAALKAWESGASEPLGLHLVIMARFYDCSPDYLLGIARDRRAGLAGVVA